MKGVSLGGRVQNAASADFDESVAQHLALFVLYDAFEKTLNTGMIGGQTTGQG